MSESPEKPVPLDLGPYRRRLRDIITGPAVTLPAAAGIREAAGLMADRNIGALLLTEAGMVQGLITERDLTRALARHGGAAADLPVRDVMTRSIISMRDDALLFRALGRMRRLSLRYLPVTNAQGDFIGMISARTLLRQRAAEAQMVADGIDVAETASELAEARAALPDLTQTLLDENLPAHEIAGVISSIYTDMTARAAAIIEAQLGAERGPAPAPWCLLVLGSGGRGESLLSPDQDNALIHSGSPQDDSWYLEAAERIAAMLDAAGIPFCKGGVMAKNAIWRGNTGEWNTRIGEWIARHSAAMLLNVDIFYDLRPVYGEMSLGRNLRQSALNAARHSPLFLRLLAEQSAQLHPAIGMFGRLAVKDGRIDLKIGGLLPLVSAARITALKTGSEATSTRERLVAAGAAGLISDDDLARLLETHELLLGCVLRQQLRDISQGIPPSTRIEKAGLKRREVAELKAALGHLGLLPDMLQAALTHA